MEQSSNRGSTLRQFRPEHLPKDRSGIWHLFNQSVHRVEVICPEPRRISRAPFVVDSLNIFCCNPKSVLPMHQGDSGLEILDIILSRDDPEGDLDSNNQVGFFCGSPPVRSSNPVIHDAQFANQTMPVASPLGNFHAGKPSVRAERGSPSCGSSFGGKPKVRIEGFPSGKSESHCVVPALA